MVITKSFLKLKRDMFMSTEATLMVRNNDKSTLIEFVMN